MIFRCFYIARIEKPFPSDSPFMRGKSKRKKFMMGVKQQLKRVVVYGAPFVIFSWMACSPCRRSMADNPRSITLGEMRRRQWSHPTAESPALEHDDGFALL